MTKVNSLILKGCHVPLTAFYRPVKAVFSKTGISKTSTETQSIGIHEVHLFNNELALHYRAIFKYGCFRLFCHRLPKCNVSNGGLWLKYKSLYGDQEFDINLIKFVQCMSNLLNNDS